MSGTLEGRLALVTGAADGIGQGIVELFAEEGARVIAVDIQHERLNTSFAGYASVHCITLDVTDRGAPERLVAFAREELGGLDILVNNAGIGGDFKHVSETTDEMYARVMAVNVEAPFRITRAFIPMLSAHGRGRIIITGSTCSHFAMTGLGVYTMSKHAVLGMTKAFAFELGHLGITSNSIEPGNTLTGITRPIFPPADTDAGKAFISQTSVLGRYGMPEDLAGAALYFASDRASYVTGRSIAVDGGMMCALYATPL